MLNLLKSIIGHKIIVLISGGTNSLSLSIIIVQADDDSKKLEPIKKELVEKIPEAPKEISETPNILPKNKNKEENYMIAELRRIP